MGITVPPQGDDGQVKSLKALTEIFDYYKNGQCKAANKALSCTANTKPYAVLIADKVQLRSEADANSGKIETLPFGTMFEVIDRKRPCEIIAARQGRWIKVKVNTIPLCHPAEIGKMPGWIFDAYVGYLPNLEP